MTLTQKRTFAETLEIFSVLNLLDKLPEDIVEKMNNSKDQNWSINFDASIPFEQNKISRTTMSFISLLYIKYISNDDAEKRYLKELYEKNKKECDIENVVKQVAKRDIQFENNTSLTTVNKKGFISRILDKIKNFFHK